MIWHAMLVAAAVLFFSTAAALFDYVLREPVEERNN